MTAYIARRIIHAIVVVGLATFVVFLLLQVIGDPVRLMLPLGASDEQIRGIRELYGFNDPILVQYWHFLRSAATGDFGESILFREPAFSVAFSALKKTLLIILPAWIIGVCVGSAAGIWAGSRPGSFHDRLISTLSFIAISIAEFWLALMLVYVFAVEFGIVATAGYGTDLQHMALPVAALSLFPFAHAVQVMRSSAMEEYRTPYVLAARARGLRGIRLAMREVLPNTVVAVLTVALYDLSVVTAAATVEVVFAWPGIGRLAVEALGEGDIFLVEAIIIISAVTVVVLQLLGDLVIFALDPRARSSAIGTAP